MLFRSGGLKAVEHGGGNKGVATHVVVVPERGLTAVALTNLANAPASKLAYGAINAYLDLAPETPWAEYPDYAIEPGTLGRFMGTYRGQPGTIAQVSEHEGTLVVDLGDGPHPARPYADRAFYIEATDDAIRFLEDETVAIWAVAVGLRTFPKIR